MIRRVLVSGTRRSSEQRSGQRSGWLTGRVVTQQKRPQVLCTSHLRLITVSVLLLPFCLSASSPCYSPKSTQPLSPTSKDTIFSWLQNFHLSFIFHVSLHKFGVVMHARRMGWSEKHRCGSSTRGHASEILLSINVEIWGSSGRNDHDLIPDR